MKRERNLELESEFARTQEKLRQIWRAKIQQNPSEAEIQEFNEWFPNENPLGGPVVLPPLEMVRRNLLSLTNEQGRAFLNSFGYERDLQGLIETTIRVLGSPEFALSALNLLIDHLNNRPKWILSNPWLVRDRISREERRANPGLVLRDRIDLDEILYWVRGQYFDSQGLVQQMSPDYPHNKWITILLGTSRIQCNFCGKSEAENWARCCRQLAYCNQDCAQADWERGHELKHL